MTKQKTKLFVSKKFNSLFLKLEINLSKWSNNTFSCGFGMTTLLTDIYISQLMVENNNFKRELSWKLIGLLDFNWIDIKGGDKCKGKKLWWIVPVILRIINKYYVKIHRKSKRQNSKEKKERQTAPTDVPQLDLVSIIFSNGFFGFWSSTHFSFLLCPSLSLSLSLSLSSLWLH